MNTHATVADTGHAIRILTSEQVTAGAVLEQALRSTHGLEVLLHDLVGTVAYQAKRADITDAQSAEARELARLLLLHADTLAAVANSASGAPATHHRLLKQQASTPATEAGR